MRNANPTRLRRGKRVWRLLKSCEPTRRQAMLQSVVNASGSDRRHHAGCVPGEQHAAGGNRPDHASTQNHAGAHRGRPNATYIENRGDFVQKPAHRVHRRPTRVTDPPRQAGLHAIVIHGCVTVPTCVLTRPMSTLIVIDLKSIARAFRPRYAEAGERSSLLQPMIARNIRPRREVLFGAGFAAYGRHVSASSASP
jgi:hypothetical protein